MWDQIFCRGIEPQIFKYLLSYYVPNERPSMSNMYASMLLTFHIMRAHALSPAADGMSLALPHFQTVNKTTTLLPEEPGLHQPRQWQGQPQNPLKVWISWEDYWKRLGWFPNPQLKTEQKQFIWRFASSLPLIFVHIDFESKLATHLKKPGGRWLDHSLCGESHWKQVIISWWSTKATSLIILIHQHRCGEVHHYVRMCMCKSSSTLTAAFLNM